MPYTGDVYAPPSGTKGVSDTTIQSSKYNAFVDDVAEAQNYPRPPTAGGTGATNATQARINLGTDDAANLTKGTLPAARLSGDYTVGNFTTTGTFTSNIGRLQGTDVNGWMIVGSNATGGTPTVALRPMGVASATGEFLVRTSGMLWSGNTVWHSGNDGAGSGLDADLLDGQQGAFFQNASNLNAGTLPAGRLSGDYTVGTLLAQGKLLTDGGRLIGADSNGYMIIATEGPGSFVAFRPDGEGSLVGQFSVFNGGMNWNGNVVWHAGNDGIGSGLDSDLVDGYHANVEAQPSTVSARGIFGELFAAYFYCPTTGVAYNANGDITGGSVWGPVGGLLAFLQTKAGISTSSDANETNFPLGHAVLVSTLGPPNRNGLVAICLGSDPSMYVASDVGGAGSPLAGTWRTSGRVASNLFLARRVA